MNWSLLLGIGIFIVMTLIVVVISLYVYIIFAHEKEKPFPGISYVIASLVLSIFLIFMTIMILPLDFISGHQKHKIINWGVEIEMGIIWKFLLFLAVASMMINNFWIRYYRYLDITRENKNDMQIQLRIKKAGIYVGKFLIYIAPIVLLGSYTIVGMINDPMRSQVVKPNELVFSEVDRWNKKQVVIKYFDYIVRIVPSFIIILGAPIIALGATVFNTIGAFGLITVPFNCFNMWIHRPKMPNADQMVMADIILQEASEEAIEKLKDLMELKEDIEEMTEEGRADEIELHNKVAIYQKGVIESQFNLIRFEEMLETKTRQHHILNENPLVYLGALIFGVISSLIAALLFSQNILKMFEHTFLLESVFFFLKEFSIIHSMIGFILFAFYLLFAIMKGFEKLTFMFPEKLGYTLLKTGRTWIDTWMIMLNILIPGSWGILFYFVRQCPNFFSFMYATKIMKFQVINVYYIQWLYTYNVLPAVFFCAVLVSISVNLSTTIKKDELNSRIAETHTSLKNNQQQYQRTKGLM